MIILSFCSLPWWLPWLLSFLLGLLTGWAIWSKYKSQVEDLESNILNLKRKISSLEDDLASCQSRRAESESELALTKGRIRELEASVKASGGVGIITSAELSDTDDDTGTSGIIVDVDKDKSSSTGGVGAMGSGSGATGSIYAALKDDNLQVIEGVGPKMESVLKDNGVATLGAVADKSSDDLRGILDNYGDKYRIIDPTTWPQQAGLAASGEWKKLIALQKSLDTGRSDKTTGVTDSKVEKLLIRMGVLKQWKQDDLKAVEGIGPKIASLLKADGITTWRELSEASVKRIQKILDAAGSRYKLADPGTWPKQAGMAADGKWEELRIYQDKLKGGKE